MMLKFQPDNDLINLKNTPLKLMSLVLLFFALNSAPTFATETLKIGTVFDRNKAGLDFYYQGIDTAQKTYSNMTIERGDYFRTCINAVQKTKYLITEKSVQVILSVKEDGCSSEIGKVAERFHNVLHIMLVFLITDFSLSSPWLSVELSNLSSELTHIVLMPKEKAVPRKKNLIFAIQQLYASFLEKMPTPLPETSQQTYQVRVPFAPLREKPARPGNDPEQEYLDLGGNKILAKLKKGDLLEGKAVITDHSDIKNHCKRDLKKNLIYDYVYTVDWMCVRVIKSSKNQDKTGWIHRMLVEEHKK